MRNLDSMGRRNTCFAEPACHRPLRYPVPHCGWRLRLFAAASEGPADFRRNQVRISERITSSSNVPEHLGKRRLGYRINPSGIRVGVPSLMFSISVARIDQRL